MNEETPEINKSTVYLTEVETLAQDILTYKETKLQQSNAQNKFREAYRALQDYSDSRTWMKLGLVHVEVPTEECKKIMKNELDKITEDINHLHDVIKGKVHELRDLEHQPGIEGFRLKPITAAEAKGIHKGFGMNE